jgi:membrane-associated protease RseP (regulator of RpoE activity)
VKLRDSEPERPVPSPNWALATILLVATLASTMLAGRFWALPEEAKLWWSGWRFALPLMLILLSHELGHYIASRLHRVPASLPYFIPTPFISAFGTLGAVILMRGRIRSARALLDVGAAGPLAGMAVALPVMFWGLSQSHLGPVCTQDCIQEGQSLLYWVCKRIALGPIPAGQDVYLHPTALAAWGGFLVTFLNLLPWGQLDGGHVAYALLGPRHHRLAPWIAAVPLLMVGLHTLRFASHALPLVLRSGWQGWGMFPKADSSAFFYGAGWWLVLSVLLLVLRRIGGPKHPPVDDPGLGRGRRAVALLTLFLFALLFMPVPLIEY